MRQIAVALNETAVVEIMDLAKWPTNRLLNTAARLTENSETSQVRSLGITQAGLTALRILSGRRHGMSRAELAEKLRVSPDTLGKVIDRLELNAFVSHRPSGSDELNARLLITPQGRMLLERADDLEEEQERTLGSDEQLRAELIARIKALGIGAHLEPQQPPPALKLVPRIAPKDGETRRSSAAG